MTHSRNRIHCRNARLAGLLLCTIATPLAAADPPAVLMQNATLTGTSNTINATWVPVVTESGIKYFNLTIQFDVDADGKLTVSADFPKQTAAPVPLVSSFRPGIYRGPSNIASGTFLISVAGPGVTAGATHCGPSRLLLAPTPAPTLPRPLGTPGQLKTTRSRRA